MTEVIKTKIWDINAVAHVRFKRVFFHENVTEEEAIEKFKEGIFISYQEADTANDEVIRIFSAEPY